MKCAKAYFKKCGTPLHRELSDLVMDVIMHRVTRFCDNSQQKSSECPCLISLLLSLIYFQMTLTIDRFQSRSIFIS